MFLQLNQVLYGSERFLPIRFCYLPLFPSVVDLKLLRNSFFMFKTLPVQLRFFLENKKRFGFYNTSIYLLLNHLLKTCRANTTKTKVDVQYIFLLHILPYSIIRLRYPVKPFLPECWFCLSCQSCSTHYPALLQIFFHFEIKKDNSMVD